MAKGGKRTYARDSNGRFASTPGSAAKKAAKSTSGRASTLGARTGLKGSRARLKAKDKADQTLQNTLSTRAQKGAVTRGSRKLAAAKTAAQTRIDGGRKGVIGRPKGRIDGPAKPAPKIDTKKAISRAIQLRNKAKQLSKQAESMMGGGRKDGAIVNVSLNSSARRSGINQAIKGSQLAARAEALNNKADRVLDRAIASRKKAEREVIKPAKKQRSAESLRISRAKQVEKRRSINITNPAGRRQDAAAKMAANAARTQKRALDFYKQKGRAPKAPVPAPKPPTRTKGSRATLPRTRGTVAKPKGLKPGEITNRIMNRDRAAIKAASTRIDRANKRSRRLASIQREIDYKRANPVGGKAFRGQATKRLNKEQRKLDKSRATVFSAIELNYKPKQQKAEARLAQMTRAVRATSDLRVSRKKAAYQRNVFGGSTVSYGR
jgi:hypothetical protein